MMERLNCNIVKDLLPNYVEELTSENTNKEIKEHLHMCQSCSREYEQMTLDIPMEKAPEVKEIKKFIHRAKAIYVMYSLFFLGMIGVVTSMIVDFAINRKLSWSLIVTGSIVFAIGVTYTAVKSKQNKLLKSLLSVTILILPLLWLIQYVVHKDLSPELDVWFWKYGAPFAVLWILILWITTIIKKIAKLNWILTIALLLFLSIPGSIITNVMCGSYDWFSALISEIGTFVTAILFCVWGLYKKHKKQVF